MSVRSWGATYAVIVAFFLTPHLARAQQLVSANDLADLEWPTPSARIAYGEEPLQFGYLRLPEGAGPHPVLIFIHGGCWLSAYDIRHAGQAEQAFSDEGYAVWSLEYRRVGDPGGGWPNTFLDVARGVDHVRRLAEDYPLDLSRVVVSGHSAGGQFALWVAGRPGISKGSELYSPRPLPIHGVLALAPAPTLETLHGAGVCGNVIDGLMGGSPDAHGERYDAASPMRLAPVGVPQRLIVGALDRAWGPEGLAYFEQARRVGASPVVLREAPESGHFEMIIPSLSTWPLVIEELRALADDMARARPGR